MQPQVLLLAKLDGDMNVAEERMFSFVSYLKDGKVGQSILRNTCYNICLQGLAIVASVVEGNVLERLQAAYKSQREAMQRNETQGFAQVITSDSVQAGVAYLIQGAGLGALRHNTVVIGFPERWRETESDTWFVQSIRIASSLHLAVVIPRNISQFPTTKDVMRGTIDVWWIVHDGGMLLLLALMLHEDKVWKNCKIRVFTVARVCIHDPA